jgi:hypothetical protein
LSTPAPKESLGLWTNRQIHDSIKPTKKAIDKVKLTTSLKLSVQELDSNQALAFPPNLPKVASGINKDSIISSYTISCKTFGVSKQVSTTKKGEALQYPPHHQLILNCTMRPSLDLQYRVQDLSIENVLVFIIKHHEAYLSSQDLTSLKQVNTLFEEMILDVIELRSIDFSPLKIPRLNYAEQQSICPHRVSLATADLIHYGLHPGMLVRYLKGEYVRESRYHVRVLDKVSSRISTEDANHIKRILTLGCPAKLVLEEESSNKLSVIKKGNQQTFLAHPEIAVKTMNKEERYSHLIALCSWVVYFLPYLCCTPQGMHKKRGKFRVIFDASTQSHQHKLVLNQVTDSEFEAIIDFGQSKMKLYVSIYNWRISFPDQILYLVLADMSACLRYPRIMADLTGAFGFLFEKLYFLSTSHVFGSNTSASSWEPFRRATKNSIPIYFFREDLVIKHKSLLDALKWDESPAAPNLVKAVRCELNKGVLNDDSSLSPPLAEIYVDGIMAASVHKEWILKLLAAIIEAIFVVCGLPDIDVHQCPLSLEKWGELIVGPCQIILGLVVDTNKMTVRMSEECLSEVRALITEKWNCKRRFFRVNDMQKLVGKFGSTWRSCPLGLQADVASLHIFGIRLKNE